MKLKFEEKKGNRIKSRFFGMSADQIGLWFNVSKKNWSCIDYKDICEYSSDQTCRSVRAFRRRLKKAPFGVKFTLSSRWVDCDVYGYGTLKMHNK
jgi:hypothetical protein